MADNRDQVTSKEILMLKEDMDGLRREVRDIHDSIAVRTEKTASQQAVQTTLAIVSVLIVLIAVLFSYFASQGVSSLQQSHDDLLSELKENSDDLAGKYADAVVELKSVKSSRAELAKNLASAKLELNEIQLELQTGKVTGDRELAETRRKYTALLEKCSMLEREINRSDALAQQITAIKQETSAKITEYLKTIEVLERQLRLLESRPAQTPSSAKPKGTVLSEPKKSKSPSPKPTKSKTAEDIKKEKERALDDL